MIIQLDKRLIEESFKSLLEELNLRGLIPQQTMYDSIVKENNKPGPFGEKTSDTEAINKTSTTNAFNKRAKQIKFAPDRRIVPAKPGTLPNRRT